MTVKDHYANVALNVLASLDDGATVGCSTCDDVPLRASEAASLYSQEITEQLPQGAVKASRGCGDPVAKAELQPGETVLDLGCGGGIDALIASRLVGETGHVYGIDVTTQMIQLAEQNAAQAGQANITFLEGQIERLPLSDESVDVVLSNCVINFSDDKPGVMREALRVLKPGGRFVVSDIVSFAPIPEECFQPLCRIVGCTKGMSSRADYLTMMEDAGFERVVLEPKTIYTLEVLKRKALQKDRMHFYAEVEQYPQVSEASGSVIIYAYKPSNAQEHPC